MITNGEFDIFPILETGRLKLRRIIESDAKEIFSIFSSEEIMEHYGMYPFISIEQAETLIERLEMAFQKNISVRWGITLKESDKLIGTCGFHNWNKMHYRIEIGYELSKEYWGKGYMKEAIAALLEFAYTEMRINRVEGLVYPENIPSRELLKRMNFKEDAVLAEYAYFRDQFQDLVMFSLVKSKWSMNVTSSFLDDIIIEELKESDAEALLILQRKANESEAILNNDYTIPPLVENVSDVVDGIHNNFTLKATYKGQMVGSIRGRLENGTCHVGRLMVDPYFQKKGLGSLLLNKIECYYPVINRFELFTSSKSLSNIRLYEKNGYIKYAEEYINENYNFVYMEKIRKPK